MAEAESDRSARLTRSRGFAFDPADLRLVADLRSDPLTRAIRNNVLGFRSPAWSDETHQALALMGESRSDAVSVAIRRTTLRVIETPDWGRRRAKIRDLNNWKFVAEIPEKGDFPHLPFEIQNHRSSMSSTDDRTFCPISYLSSSFLIASRIQGDASG